jgi:ketosteroid isomerase-like protein
MLLALTLATTASAQSAKLGGKDLIAIRSASEAFAKGLLTADFASVSKLYTETATLMPPNQGAVEGRAAILAWMQAFPPVKDFKLAPVDIDGRGDLAYVRGTFSMTFVPPGAPGPIIDVGKYVEIRRRQADGSWLIVADIFNSDQPLAK